MYFKNIYLYVVLNEWLNFKKCNIKNSSYFKYKFVIDNYLIQYFSKIKIKNLKYKDIILFFESDNIKKLSCSTKNLIFTVLYSSIKYSIKKGYCKNIDMKPLSFKEKNKNINYLTLTEQKILEKYIKNNINIRNLLILTTLYSGARIGEICALKWEDIDFINNTISIKRTVQRIKYENSEFKTKLIVDIPKTKSSIRIIPIPSFIVVLLKNYMFDKDCFVFTNSNNPKDPRSVEKYFSNLLKKLNIRHLKFHSLRHTFATRLREQKVDIKVISELLGHSDWKITQEIYVHSSFDIKKKSVNELSKLWNKKG